MKKIKLRNIFNILFIILVGMIFGSLLMLYQQKSILTRYRNSNKSDYTKFEIIKQLLQSEYIQPELLTENGKKMIEKAIAGFVDGLEDPYTNYLTSEENKELQQALQEESGIEGIGAVIEKKENYIQIAEIIKNGPAYKAGLLPLDQILFINSGSTQDFTTSEAVAQIRGEKGTEVLLFIHREAKTDEQESENFWINITRDSIDIPSVVANLTEYNGKKIGIFEISSISEYTTKIFMNEILDFINQDMEGIILDLRGNGGGYLEEASKFLGHFLKKGETTVKSKYYAFEDKTLNSKGIGELSTYPLVILVDQLTASAGEIIALTLQEQGATIIGIQTLGKGTIQTVEEFPDGSSLKYTVGKWYSPNDISIDVEGITPDIEVKRDYEAYVENKYDNQLEEAKKSLATSIEEK